MFKSSNYSEVARLALAFAAVYIIWGSTYLAIRYAVETLPPFMMGGFRFVAAGGVLFIWTHLRGVPLPGWRQWRNAAIIGCLLFAFANGGVVWSEQYIDSGLAALIITSVPLWMVVFDWIRPNGVRPNAPILLGLFLGFVGIFILIDPGNIAERTGGSIVPVLVLLAASMSWAFGSVLVPRLSFPSSLVQTSGMKMFTGGLAFLIISTVSGEWSTVDPGAFSEESVLAFFYLIVFGSIIGFTAYTYLLKNTTASKASTYAYVNPVIAVFLGWSIADEPVSFQTMIAAAIIIVSVAIITTNKQRLVKERKEPIEAVVPDPEAAD